MVKVCHMTSAHNSDDARIFHLECASLAAAGYDTYLVARGDSREDKGVHIVGVGQAPSNRVKRMIDFTKSVYDQALTLNADIYHLHDPELIPYGNKLKKQGKKVIFDSHENTLEQMKDKAWIPAPFRPGVSLAYRNTAVKAFEKYDCLISVTPHIVDQLSKINPNTWMITNYPIYEQYTETKKVSQQYTLCFTGGVDSQWCHEHIIDSIAGIEGARYVLCGPCEMAYLEKLKQCDGWSKVQYAGLVTHKKAVEFQQNADVGIAVLQPSRNSGWMQGTIGNTKLFEYMMAGLPVICTDFVLWKDIIERYNCGICVKYNDVKTMTEAILFLRDHPQEARKMGENGRRAVKEEFNWGTQEEKLLELYEELLRE